MPATYPLTGSTLQSNISTGLSTQILVKVGNETVGAIQSLSINQARNVERVGEVGLDGTLELVHNQKTTYAATVKRIVFDRLRLPEAFARGFINIKSQLLPFDILIIDRTNGDNEGSVSHQLINCRFKAYDTTYEANNFIITEGGGIEIEDISSSLGTGSENAAQGGARGLDYQVNSRERSTDKGDYRGTMDVADIINAAFE